LQFAFGSFGLSLKISSYQVEVIPHLLPGRARSQFTAPPSEAPIEFRVHRRSHWFLQAVQKVRLNRRGVSTYLSPPHLHGLILV